ncbi:serine/arginine repetitive matrix protein 1-like isoform X4 [Daphnia pulex]|uniref:serine/arginine repetitive matrix protein 1-like isoform X4 n=1 Tax=Daphnia pulex TaxID=6669 RepID=UPI001EE0B530|nr:serine/arginine repetitive matrix protein 1-like isoform X4 [Daphnia pulex]
MSDGSSATQIGGISDREVAIVDSLDSITTTNSDEDDGSSDCSSSDIGSSYISDQDEEPISIVTNIRPSPLFHPEDEEEEEAEIEEKSPAGGRIAKDTGCCLYSAITAIFVMVVLIGIVLIVTGPVLGLSFPPLFRANTPVILPPMEHNYLTANFSDEIPAVDEDVLHSNNNPEADYAEQYDPGDGTNNQTADSFEYADYLEDQPQANLTDFLAATLNNSAGIFNESVIEDLANLSPEALRTKYVAYVPIPLKIDDGEEEQSDYQEEDVEDASVNDRSDNHYNQEDDTYYEEEMATPRSSSAVRRRPTIEKVLLPIVMVPESSNVGEQQHRTQTSQGSDSWRSSEYSEDRSSNPPRRFDGEQMEIRVDNEEDLTSSPSLRIPGLNFPRRGNNRPDHDRRRRPGIDYRMFGSPPHPNNRRNKRPNRFRDRDRERFRPRDDFGRTTSLHPHRVLPPPNRSRSRNKINRQREVEGREGNPALYIRPPPRPRPRENQQPIRQRVQRPPSVPESWVNRQRTIDPPVTSTKRPAYSYPRDAMSIQDIISYMTSMSHSNEKTTKKPNLTPTGPDHRTAVWTNSPDYYSNNQRVGQSYPSVLPPPPSMGISSRAHDSLPIESHTRGVSSPGSNPYSFKLDVYPIRDSLLGGGSSSSSSSSSNYVPPGPSYKQQSVLPPPSYRYRPTSSYYESRQPSGDSSGSLSDPYNYRRRPQQHGSGSQEQYRYRDNDDDADMPLPLAYRPRRPEATTPKPKLVVHLNVFNQKGDRNRYADERRDSQEAEDDYYSPSDIYRAVLRNNAAKTTHDHEGGDDSLMLSGQSRIDTFSQHQMDQNGGDSSSGSSSSSSSSNSYDNHNMAASSPTDHYYRSMGTRRSSSSPAATNAANNYRISHQSRNFYPAIDDDVPEPLPMPMAAQQSAEESADSALSSCLTSYSGGVNCTQGSSVIPSADRVNNTQTAPLVIS